MRYMLYDAGKEKITLEQELEYLNSYISLQDFRLEKEGFVQFNINGNANELQIPPMLFTPFVENAFKHGRKWDAQTGIVIRMDIKPRFLHFEIRNFFDSSRAPDIKRSEGVGLKNVRRRLELLYPDKHDLEIIKKDDTFIVRLRIELE